MDTTDLAVDYWQPGLKGRGHDSSVPSHPPPSTQVGENGEMLRHFGRFTLGYQHSTPKGVGESFTTTIYGLL